jgi:hypothetical protein
MLEETSPGFMYLAHDTRKRPWRRSILNLTTQIFAEMSLVPIIILNVYESYFICEKSNFAIADKLKQLNATELQNVTPEILKMCYRVAWYIVTKASKESCPFALDQE